MFHSYLTRQPTGDTLYQPSNSSPVLWLEARLTSCRFLERSSNRALQACELSQNLYGADQWWVLIVVAQSEIKEGERIKCVPVPLSNIGTRLLDSLTNIEENRKSLACLRVLGESPGSYFIEMQCAL